MIETKPIEWPGFDHIEKNATFYREVFLRDKLIVFRNANLDQEGHDNLSMLMGEILDGYPKRNAGQVIRYTENHQNLGKTAADDTGEDLRVYWHQEHLHLDNDVVFAVWRNTLLKIDENKGKGYFIDMSKVYRDLPEETQEFLKKCISSGYNNTTRTRDDSRLVGYHWITNVPYIRMEFSGLEIGLHDLRYYDGKPCTHEENLKFLRIARNIRDIVDGDEENRIVHKWHKGDIVIPDIELLAHAVTGGFSPDEREFTGLWSFKDINV